MKLAALSIGLLLVSSSLLQGQDQSVPDTLDWQRYFPLEIGNEWQYRIANQPFQQDQYVTLKVLRDTLIDQRLYFTMRGVFYDHDFEVVSEEVSYVRYDTTSATVLQVGLSSGGNSESWWTFIPCGLDANFNSVYTCRDATMTMWGVFGDYGANVTVGNDVVAAASFKVYDSLGGTLTLVSDIGLIESVPEGSVPERLEYAKIGDEVYGLPVVTVDSEEILFGKKKNLSLQVFPMPFSDRTKIIYKVPSTCQVFLLIFDGLGKTIRKEDLGYRSAGTHHASVDLTAQSSGTYYFQIHTDKGSQLIISAIKIP